MKEKLIQYVNLLFAGIPNSGEIQQEILQNTLDRYDDLLSQGKSPEAAYRLAIVGIGDINEILGNPETPHHSTAISQAPKEPADTPTRKLVRAIAIGLYIISPLPLIVLDELADMDILGLCATIVIVAVATVMLLLTGKREKEKPDKSPKSKLHKSVDTLLWTLSTALYFLVSFSTGAWYITWLIFLIAGAAEGLIDACFDLKEGIQYEN